MFPAFTPLSPPFPLALPPFLYLGPTLPPALPFLKLGPTPSLLNTFSFPFVFFLFFLSSLSSGLFKTSSIVYLFVIRVLIVLLSSLVLVIIWSRVVSGVCSFVLTLSAVILWIVVISVVSSE